MAERQFNEKGLHQTVTRSEDVNMKSGRSAFFSSENLTEQQRGLIRGTLLLLLLVISSRGIQRRHSIIFIDSMPMLTRFTVLRESPLLSPAEVLQARLNASLAICKDVMRETKRSAGNCPVKCLRVASFGGWGNQIVQLLATLQLAIKLGASRILFEPKWAKLRQALRYDDNLIFEPNNVSDLCMTDYFYWRPKNSSDLAFLNLTLARDFRERYVENIGIWPRETPDDELTIHVRTTGIFTPYRDPAYAQPTCAFYDDIIRERKWSRIVLVAADEENPCIARIKQYGAFHEVRNWNDDLAILMNAKNLVIGRGTLGIAVATLSAKLVNLYTFNLSCSRLNVPRHRNCIPTDEYYRDVISQYDKIPDKKGPLLKYPSGTWEDVPYGLQEKERIYMHDGTLSRLL